MPVVNARDIARSFGPRRILVDVSLTIQRGERVGVVGANGSGKSTLGRILAGLDSPDRGEVARRRGARIAYLDQRPHMPDGVSALDMALGGLETWWQTRERYNSLSAQIAGGEVSAERIDSLIAAQTAAAEELEREGGWNLVHRAEAILGHLGIADPSRDAARMSGGEQRRVALARVLIARADLAILDEPTNHLDLDTIEWLERYLIEEHEGALLLITHDRYILDRVSTRTVELSNGQLSSYEGGYENYLQIKAERLAHEERVESNRQNLLRTELEWLRRQPKARATKSQARIARIEAVAAIEKPRGDARVELAASELRSGKTVLELHDLTLRYSDRALVEGLTLHLGKGERVGIVGPNGCGKSTLLRCLLGDLEPSAGEVVRGANTRVGYLEQGSTGLDEAATVIENVAADRNVIELGGRDFSPRLYLERFLFDYTAQQSIVSTLSGGERARVALARMLAMPSNLLLLDEPTNDLDVPTLGALETLLLEFRGTVLVVTHDRYFLDRIATSILAFESDGRVVRHHGNYSTYLELRREAEKPSAVASAPVRAAERPRNSTKLSYAEERERQALPDRIEAVEQRIGELTRELADPELYARRGAQVNPLLEELDQRRAEVEQMIARWEELETRSEALNRD